RPKLVGNQNLKTGNSSCKAQVEASYMRISRWEWKSRYERMVKLALGGTWVLAKIDALSGKTRLPARMGQTLSIHRR
ncbi:hypothetical protein COCVIDRAFT_89469, partial [Bipolaris victoriae FI3]